MEPSTDNRSSQYGQVISVRYEPYAGPQPMDDWPEIREGGTYNNRRRGIGSSDATAIAGVSKYANAYSLYLVVRGEIPKPQTAFPEVAEVGLLLEPVIAGLYARKKRRPLIDRATYDANGQRWDVRRHADIQWMIANLDLEVDAISGDAVPLDFQAAGNGVAEFKSKDPWGDIFDDDGNVTDDIQVQFQHQLAVAGLEWGSVAALVGRRFYSVDMPRHDDFIEWLIAEEARFVERCFNGDPPEIDAHGATGNAIAERFPVEQKKSEVELSDALAALLPEWQRLRREIAAAEQRKEEIENRLKFAIGDAEEGWTKDRRWGFSWKKAKDSLDKYVIKTKGRLEEAEEQIIEELGGEFQLGKKGSRRFTVKREPEE